MAIGHILKMYKKEHANIVINLINCIIFAKKNDMNELMNKTGMPKPYLLEVMADYYEVEKNIGKIIESTGYKNEYIAKKLGMPISTYYIKKRNKSFAFKEVYKIVKMLDDDTTYNQAELELMESRKNDEEMSAEDFKTQIMLMIQK
jgi:hypothetical protein